MQPLEKNSNVSLVNQFRVSLNSVKFVLYDLKIKLMQKQKNALGVLEMSENNYLAMGAATRS